MLYILYLLLYAHTFHEIFHYILGHSDNPSFRILFLVLILLVIFILRHKKNILKFLTKANQYNRNRAIIYLFTSFGIYLAFCIIFFYSWYIGYENTSFHFFDDFGMWNNIDKIGHFYGAYLACYLSYLFGRWSGISKSKCLILSIFWAILFQFTIEIWDAFSEKWGFSIYDCLYNILGIIVFYLQYKYLSKYLFSIKLSSILRDYTDINILGHQGTIQSTKLRRENLFGSSPFERYLKDYNSQTYWVSFNLNKLLKTVFVPQWFNIAIGYGAKNMYGGFSNKWSYGNEIFSVNELNFERETTLFFAIDIDLRLCYTKTTSFNLIKNILNLIKIPSPVLELDSGGKIKFHICL